MEYLRGCDIGQTSPSVLSVGKFSSLHLGHRSIISQAIDMAHQISARSALLSFDPKPGTPLFSSSNQNILTWTERKRILQCWGLDLFVKYPFTTELSNMSAEAFAREILFEKLRAKAIFVGDFFRFGKNREGDVSLLTKLAAEYNAQILSLPEISADEQKISSSTIKSHITNGSIGKANRLLGYDYFISGTVSEGKHIGRTIGFPTLNITPGSDKLLPKHGVYITQTLLCGKLYPSITNVGTNPTVDGNRVTVESNLIGFNETAYNRKVTVHFHKQIREQVKFNTLNDLKNQISKDRHAAVEYFKL